MSNPKVKPGDVIRFIDSNAMLLILEDKQDVYIYSGDCGPENLFSVKNNTDPEQYTENWQEFEILFNLGEVIEENENL